MNDITEKTKPKSTVAYLRSASAGQIDSRLSLKRQRLACKRYAHQLGLHLGATYSDVGVSGLAEHRPALDQLMLDLSRGRICRIVIADAARLARSRQLEQRIQQRIRNKGATLTMPCPSLDGN